MHSTFSWFTLKVAATVVHPGFWEGDIIETAAPISTKFCTVVETTGYSSWWSKYAIDKSKMVDGCHLLKPKRLNIFATGGLVSTNFCRMVQMGSPERTVFLRPFEISKIQDGVGRHLENPLNCYISATVWPISTEFGTLTRVGTPDPYKS